MAMFRPMDRIDLLLMWIMPFHRSPSRIQEFTEWAVNGNGVE
jgi:hypothetical protein